MKTDNIFYNLFQLFPELLFELIGADPSQAPNYEFSSREIKELARRFDGLFIPSSDEFTDILYFVEVQFQAKPNFYRRLFAGIFVYLEQYEPANDWAAVAIFASRNLDPELSPQYADLRGRLRVIYLDEMESGDNLPISLGIVKLVVMAPDTEQVRGELPGLFAKLPQQISDLVQEREIFDFIETILLYKFPKFSREEIEKMFKLSDLRQSKVYQEAEARGKLLGKLNGVPGFLALGLSVEQVAGASGLEVALVERVAAGEVVEAIVAEVLGQNMEVVEVEALQKPEI